MSTQSQIIPSGRAREKPPVNWANVATVIAMVGLLALGLLGISVESIALAALIVLGSLLILSDPSLEDKGPHVRLV